MGWGRDAKPGIGSVSWGGRTGTLGGRSGLVRGSSALAGAGSNRGLGSGARSKRLKLVVQLRRFLVLEATRRPNLASQCLGAGLRELVVQIGTRAVCSKIFKNVRI